MGCPADIVWTASGRPGCGPKEKTLTWARNGVCGQCVQRDGREVTLARKVMSHNFGSWDDIATTTDGLQWLCRTCAWAYKDATIRSHVYRIETGGAVVDLDWPDLVAEIRESQIPTTVAYCVPIGGKRIVLPRTRWGMLATDHGTVHWQAHHARTLCMVCDLRALGCTESALLSKSMPIGTGATPHQQAHSSQLWDNLAIARRSPLWPMFVKMSRPSRATKAMTHKQVSVA